MRTDPRIPELISRNGDLTNFQLFGSLNNRAQSYRAIMRDSLIESRF